VNIFQRLADFSNQQQLGFLVIGAHAVNAYGYSRETADLDLLIDKQKRDVWLSWFLSLNYRVFRDGGNFLQLTAPDESAWPVDLMLVAAPTFSAMLAESRVLEEQPAKPRIPCLEHLLALKLHALKHTRLQRFLKDFQDVLGLIECQKLDARSEKVQQLFQNMAPSSCMRKYSERSIEEALASFQPEPADLDFPIDPDFVSKPPRLPWQAIYQRSEESLPRKTMRPEFEEQRLASKIAAEFVL
jgi:hypothetical protein